LVAIGSEQNDADPNRHESGEAAGSLLNEIELHPAENQPIQSYAEVNAQPAVLSAQGEVAKGEVRTEETYLRALFDTVPAGIFVVDAQTRRIVDINHHALQLIGQPVTQIIGSICNSVVCPASEPECPILDLGETVNQSERILLTAGGGRLPILKSVVPAIRNGRKVLVESFVSIRNIKEAEAQAARAIKELEEAKQAAEQAALQDPLTKLPNRRLFHDRLNLCLQIAERNPGYLCGLLYLDLDDFKIVNDSLGHQVGDKLLVEVANRLETSLRRTDVLSRFAGGVELVGRLGGDEFAILLDNIKDASDALRVADRIAEKFQEPFHVRGRDLSVTASIGITTSASRYPSAEDMLRDADIAMYRAKAGGRGRRVVFDEAMHRRAVERLHLESELRQAVEKKEFIVYYQPIVSLSSNHIVGFEALLRWQSPLRGLVEPDVFIPVAEQTGLIVPIGDWVLREACMQLRRWQQHFSEEPPLTMSVNLSARQFLQWDLVATVKRTLQETGIEGCSLYLELTESVAMGESKRTLRTLEKLKHLGVRLSIDDFGSGYSSLDQLHRLSADTLKVDRHFVARMTANDRNHKIVNTIITLGHNLQMYVIVEGAETAEQLALLVGMACDYVQGYVFSRPLDPKELEVWMEARCEKARLPL
jgi:diguanylate cyclase (GGDEF)-like protein/PAS domain S-box-containing protein